MRSSGLGRSSSGAASFLPGFSLPRNWLLACIYATVLLITICSQFFIPSRVGLIGQIVPDQARERASGLAQTSSALAMILGPAIAAPLFFAVGAKSMLSLDALSFLVSFAFILLVPAPPAIRGQDEHSFAGEFLAGMRLVATNRILRTLLVAGTVFVLGEAALNTLSVFFLQQNLHASPKLFGLIAAAQGGGTLLGAALAALVARRIGAGRSLWLAATCFGMLVLILSRLTTLAPALAVIGLTGAMFAVMEVAETPLLLRASPADYVGRVVAILLPSYSVGDTISALGAGWLASTALQDFHTSVFGLTLGPIDTIYASAGLLSICGGLYAMVSLRTAPHV